MKARSKLNKNHEMTNIVKKFDNLQYNNRALAFVVAVIKRYSDDKAGSKAALVTYYLFMSLFPLIIWLAQLSNWLNRYYPGAADYLIRGATFYFPVIGNKLFDIAHNSTASLTGLLVPGLIALYGARGTALTFLSALGDMWGVPEQDRFSFPWNWLRGIGVVVVGGGGFIFTAIATSWAAAKGHGLVFATVVAIISVILLTLVFVAILRLSLPRTIRIHKVISGALSMSVALTILQLVGGYLITHNLRSYTNAYTALFSVALGLLAWIYLVAQVLFYSTEITLVIDRKLWPRRLT